MSPRGAIETTHNEIRDPSWASPTIHQPKESWSYLSLLDTSARELTPTPALGRDSPTPHHRQERIHPVDMGIGELALSAPLPEVSGSSGPEWTAQLTSRPADGSWVGPPWHLPHLGPAGACEGTGRVGQWQQDLLDSGGLKVSLRSSSEYPVMMVCQKPGALNHTCDSLQWALNSSADWTGGWTVQQATLSAIRKNEGVSETGEKEKRRGSYCFVGSLVGFLFCCCLFCSFFACLFDCFVCFGLIFYFLLGWCFRG